MSQNHIEIYFSCIYRTQEGIDFQRNDFQFYITFASQLTPNTFGLLYLIEGSDHGERRKKNITNTHVDSSFMIRPIFLLFMKKYIFLDMQTLSFLSLFVCKHPINSYWKKAKVIENSLSANLSSHCSKSNRYYTSKSLWCI